MSSPGRWLLAALRWMLFSTPAATVVPAVTALLSGPNLRRAPLGRLGCPTPASQR